MKALFWFRADLRIQDNIGLQQAMQAAETLVAIYIITPETWKRHDMAPIKVQFILNHLQALSEALWQQGIPLLIRTTPYYSDCPQLIQEVCEQYHIESLYFNNQYEVDEQRRDAKLTRVLKKKKTQQGFDIAIHAFEDQLVLAPGAIFNGQNLPYKVFTPFKKAWLAKAADTIAWRPITNSHKKFNQNLQDLDLTASLSFKPDLVPKSVAGFNNTVSLSLWPAGELAAQGFLERFIEKHINNYHTQRDFPNVEGTSRLSAYLALGVISPRQCVKAVLQHYEVDTLLGILKYEGPSTWISELIWREFYKHIMFHFPQVSRNKPFKLETDQIIWNQNKEQFQAWCDGNTGYPLVDAAMRQLNQTGWMHNRLRMVVANFLTKVLFLNWRLGEKYFMQHLIDGDLAANNGGWQWSASTGTDAAPYFRIFNPILQSERFDAEGNFIKKYCPELKDFDKKTIHEPYQRAPELARKSGYPKPIVDLKQHRLAVLDAFKNLKET